MSVARLALWFATAYTIVVLVHEGAHAVVASALGLETTLFHFWVTVDPNDTATVGQRAAFGVAGPLSSLALGVVAAVFYARARGPATAVPLLLLAANGVSNFFGNLTSASFVGDFSNVSGWLGIPMWVRYAASAIGAVAVAGVLFAAGRALRSRLPAERSRWAAAGLGVVVPAAVGTSIVIVINQPVAMAGFATSRAGEALFWLFAAAGVATADPRSTGTEGAGTLRWADVAVALAVGVMVRLLVPGVPLHLP